MEWNETMILVLQVILAFILGGIIGWERERTGRAAGIRTFAAIAGGSCVFGIISLHAHGVVDTTRIASQVVTGVGFLGIGIMFRHGDYIKGVTTAAAVWATAAVGLAIAFSLYTIGIITALILFVMLGVARYPGWQKFTGAKKEKLDD